MKKYCTALIEKRRCILRTPSGRKYRNESGETTIKSYLPSFQKISKKEKDFLLLTDKENAVNQYKELAHKMETITQRYLKKHPSISTEDSEIIDYWKVQIMKEGWVNVPLGLARLGAKI